MVPIALLTVVRGPNRLTDWLWLSTLLVLALVWRSLPTDLFTRVSGASSLFFGGSFVVFTVIGIKATIHRSILAAIFTTLVVIAGLHQLGIDYGGFRNTLTSDLWQAMRAGPTKLQLPETMPPSRGFQAGIDPRTLPVAQRMADFAVSFSHYIGASLALLALFGASLASRVVRSSNPRPTDPPLEDFSAFRFTDHLIWLLIFAMIMSLIPGTVPWFADLGRNLLIVTLALYCARGAAIVRVILSRSGPIFLMLLFLAVLFLFAPVLFGCIMLGIADTWLDLRRRLPPQGVTR